jgi:hypothetical protein
MRGLFHSQIHEIHISQSLGHTFELGGLDVCAKVLWVGNFPLLHNNQRWGKEKL